jgi:uncharacterized protein (DUF934 family)
MPRLIKLAGGVFDWADDRFRPVGDDEPVPPGDVTVSFTRFMAEGEALLSGRALAVRVEPDQPVEDLAYDLHRLAAVALAFPRFGDGRAYTSARLLRERYGYTGEVRAVGQALREQALHMVRCGFDAFEPADGSTPEDWAAAAGRYRHVYQRAADARAPAFVERGNGA